MNTAVLSLRSSQSEETPLNGETSQPKNVKIDNTVVGQPMENNTKTMDFRTGFTEVKALRPWGALIARKSSQILGSGQAHGQGEEVSVRENMLFIDVEKCTGCKTCEIYCSFINAKTCNPTMSRVRIIKWEYAGINAPIMCMQCEDAPCMASCPVTAIRKEASGMVTIDQDTCIGCKLCLMNCPLGAISMDPREGKAFKCNLCGGDPICAKMCATGAIRFLSIDRAAMMKKRAGMDTIMKSQRVSMAKASGGE